MDRAMKNNKFASLICYISLVLSFYSTHSRAEEPLTPMPSNSIFMEQIDLETYGSLPSPVRAPALRWDFSAGKVYQYDFSQQVVTSSDMSGMSAHKNKDESSQKMEGYGKLSLKSEGNNIARLVLEDFIMSMEINMPDSDEPKVMSSQMPPFVVQGVKDDGSMELGNSSQELFFQTLFPLPPNPLSIGESVSVPAKMPFNAMGSLLHVTGTFDIKLIDYVQINGKTCAKLQTEIDISKINVPEEILGNYRCQIKGRSIFFFNIEDRHFISGKVAMLMSMRVKSPTPKMELPDGTSNEDMPETITMSMDSDNLITVEFIKI